MCEKKGFSAKEIKTLIVECDKAKRENKPLVGVFKKFAKDNERSFGSVRNFYYGFLSKARGGNERCCRYVKGYDLTVSKPERFTVGETKNLIDKVVSGKRENKSLRSIMYELGGGDDKLMLRYQNKYRNLLKTEPNAFSEQRERTSFVRKKRDFQTLREEIGEMVEGATSKIVADNLALTKRVAELQTENATLKSGT